MDELLSMDVRKIECCVGCRMDEPRSNEIGLSFSVYLARLKKREF